MCGLTGRELLACTWCPPDFAPYTFLLTCFALYPSLVMSLSCEHFMLSLLSPFRELLNMELVLRLILDIDIKMFVLIWVMGYVCICRWELERGRK